MWDLSPRGASLPAWAVYLPTTQLCGGGIMTRAYPMQPATHGQMLPPSRAIGHLNLAPPVPVYSYQLLCKLVFF